MGRWDGFNQAFLTTYNSGMERKNSPEMQLYNLYKKDPEGFRGYVQAKSQTPGMMEMILPMLLGGMGGSNGLKPGEIKVRDKKSGQVGAIMPNEFDPNLYERM